MCRQLFTLPAELFVNKILKMNETTLFATHVSLRHLRLFELERDLIPK